MERNFHVVGIRCVSYSKNGGSLVCLPWQRRGGGGKERAFEASSLTVTLQFISARQWVGIPDTYLLATAMETAQGGVCEGRSVPFLAQHTL